MQRGPGGIGIQLQQAREARGLSIAEMAATTRISERAILAIERENVHLLPGGIFRPDVHTLPMPMRSVWTLPTVFVTTCSTSRTTT